MLSRRASPTSCNDGSHTPIQRSIEKRRTTAKLSKEMTRTFKCTHTFNIKTMCKPYDSPPNTSAQLSNQVAGRLSLFVTNWEVLTTDKWVIQAVKGFQILFTSQPDKKHWPSPAMYSSEQSLLIQEEVSTLLDKGTVLWIYSPQPQESFYSTLFPVSKKEAR